MSVESENAAAIAEAFFSGPLDPDMIMLGKKYADYADRCRILSSINSFRKFPFKNEKSTQLINEASKIIYRDHELQRKDTKDYMALFNKIKTIQIQLAKEKLSPESYEKVLVEMKKM